MNMSLQWNPRREHEVVMLWLQYCGLHHIFPPWQAAHIQQHVMLCASAHAIGTGNDFDIAQKRERPAPAPAAAPLEEVGEEAIASGCCQP